MKKLGLATIALSALLLSGCGGGGSKKSKSITEQISERQAVFIIHGANRAFCELMLTALKKDLEMNALIKDEIIDTPANTVSCATYGKTESDTESAFCSNDTLANSMDTTPGADDITLFEDASTACVLGVNKK